MFAVVRKTDPFTVLCTCSTKEAAIIAAQLEKEKLPLSRRPEVSAVVLDDEGYADIQM